MKKYLLVLATTFLPFIAATDSTAGIYWTPRMDSWQLYVNNGVVYVSSSSMPSHCSYSRAQVETNTNFPHSQQNNKELYAYILSASILGKPLSIVVDSDVSECVIYGADTN